MPSRDSEWEVWVEGTRVALDNKIKQVASKRRRRLTASLEAEKEQFFEQLVDQRFDDRGAVTVMFSDLVESTAGGLELGDEVYQPLRTRHAQHVRQAVKSLGVYVKNTGDGHLCWFARLNDAVEAARTIQRSAADERDRESRFPMVRVSLHTGEPAWAYDNPLDPQGTTVNFAARLNSSCTPGRILMSDVSFRILKEVRPKFAATSRACNIRTFGRRTVWEVTP